jgi:hypothetical protein
MESVTYSPTFNRNVIQILLRPSLGLFCLNNFKNLSKIFAGCTRKIYKEVGAPLWQISKNEGSGMGVALKPPIFLVLMYEEQVTDGHIFVQI